MGYQDNLIKDFFSDPFVFADVFNFWLHDGAQIIQPDLLREASESLISFSSNAKHPSTLMDELAENKTKDLKSNEKTRDHIKHLICKEDGSSVYAILALESQSDVDYSMVARAMIYDGRQYEKQIAEIRKKHEHAIAQSKETWTLRKFTKDDRLTPVITVVVYLGSCDWDGPRTLHSLLSTQDPTLLKYAADYKLNLIEPIRTSDEDIEKFQSDMREVMLYAKAVSDADYLAKLCENKKIRRVSIPAARVIQSITKTKLDINEEMEDTDVYNAMEVLLERRYAMGHTEGKSIGRTEGITIGRTAGQANSLLIYMKKQNCDLFTAMDFFEIEEADRPSVMEYIQSHQ